MKRGSFFLREAQSESPKRIRKDVEHLFYVWDGKKKCNSPPLDANPRFHCSIPNFFCTVGRCGSTCTLRVGQGFECRRKEINFNSEFPSGLCLRPFEPFIKLSHSSHILERNTVRKEQWRVKSSRTQKWGKFHAGEILSAANGFHSI